MVHPSSHEAPESKYKGKPDPHEGFTTTKSQSRAKRCLLLRVAADKTKVLITASVASIMANTNIAPLLPNTSSSCIVNSATGSTRKINSEPDDKMVGFELNLLDFPLSRSSYESELRNRGSAQLRSGLAGANCSQGNQSEITDADNSMAASARRRRPTSRHRLDVDSSLLHCETVSKFYTLTKQSDKAQYMDCTDHVRGSAVQRVGGAESSERNDASSVMSDVSMDSDDRNPSFSSTFHKPSHISNETFNKRYDGNKTQPRCSSREQERSWNREHEVSERSSMMSRATIKNLQYPSSRSARRAKSPPPRINEWENESYNPSNKESVVNEVSSRLDRHSGTGSKGNAVHTRRNIAQAKKQTKHQTNNEIVTSSSHRTNPNEIKTQQKNAHMWLRNMQLKEGSDAFPLGYSSSRITHRISRGSWTWGMAWSPDATRLAVGSENRSFAVVRCSGVAWNVIYESPLGLLPHSTIRAIAWNDNYIAIGGIGDAVSILDGETYVLLHTIPSTGFVGSLSWKRGSDVLAIGNREDQCRIVDIRPDPFVSSASSDALKHMQLCAVEREEWVNAVSFSPTGSMLAVGDATGMLSIYSCLNDNYMPERTLTLEPMSMVYVGDSILALEWSPNEKYVYVGGEDFAITIIDTVTGEEEDVLQRDRWVQCLACSHAGGHVAAGGDTSQISLLDVGLLSTQQEGCEQFETINVPYTGPVVLSARWHPQDEFLAISGQGESIDIIETNLSRYVQGGIVKFEKTIASVDFSPDGSILALGADDGIVTFLDTTSGANFSVMYELVMAESASTFAVRWSPNGNYVAVGAGSTVVFLSVSPSKPNLQAVGPVNSMPKLSNRFSVYKVVRGLKVCRDICISPDSKLVIVTGMVTKVFDVASNFVCIQEFKLGMIMSCAFSQGGSLLGLIGRGQMLFVYDVEKRLRELSSSGKRWKAMLEIKCEAPGFSLTWGPSTATVEHEYLAYGGEDKKVTVIEINKVIRKWRTVVELPRQRTVHDMDWTSDGMLAIADGIASIVDLSYLNRVGFADDKNYSYKKTVLSATDISRQECDVIRALRWLKSEQSQGRILALVGLDGVVELIDFTDRKLMDRQVAAAEQLDACLGGTAGAQRSCGRSMHERMMFIAG